MPACLRFLHNCLPLFYFSSVILSPFLSSPLSFPIFALKGHTHTQTRLPFFSSNENYEQQFRCSEVVFAFPISCVVLFSLSRRLWANRSVSSPDKNRLNFSSSSSSSCPMYGEYKIPFVWNKKEKQCRLERNKTPNMGGDTMCYGMLFKSFVCVDVTRGHPRQASWRQRYKPASAVVRVGCAICDASLTLLLRTMRRAGGWVQRLILGFA